jgi:hypothetical protein
MPALERCGNHTMRGLGRTAIVFALLFASAYTRCTNNVLYENISFADAEYCFCPNTSRLLIVNKNNDLKFRIPRKKLLTYKGHCYQEIITEVEIIDASGKSIMFYDSELSRLGGTRLISVSCSDCDESVNRRPDTIPIPKIPDVLRIDSPPERLFTKTVRDSAGEPSVLRYSADEMSPFAGTFVTGHTVVSISCYPESDTIYTPEYDTAYNFNFRAKIIGICDERCY